VVLIILLVQIHGKIDTEPVNKCNDCQNEWKIAEYYDPYVSTLNAVADRIYDCLRHIHKAYNETVEFDVNDLSEKFASAEEKRQHDVENILDNFWVKQTKDLFSGYSIELMPYIFLSEFQDDSYHLEKWNEFDKSLLQTVLKMKSICNQ
jgi:hypothetical protein